MIRWAIIFAIIAVIAGVFGFAGAASAAATIAKTLFGIAVALIVIFLIGGVVAGRSVARHL